MPLGRLANQVARMGPETLCQKLNTALGTATMGEAAKCRPASVAPSPEFCMPTSMAMALAS